MIENLGITPGPWTYHGKCAYGHDVYGDGKWIADAKNVQSNDETTEANARLIAAAPEMLEEHIDNKILAELAGAAITAGQYDLALDYVNAIETMSRRESERATGLTWAEIKERINKGGE